MVSPYRFRHSSEYQQLILVSSIAFSRPELLESNSQLCAPYEKRNSCVSRCDIRQTELGALVRCRLELAMVKLP